MILKRVLGISSLAILLTVAATAAPFSAVVVYGDSLSDNGNLFAATGQPGPPYFMGRVSNGPVAAEILAGNYGVPLLDFAWGGATSGVGNHLDPGGTATTVGAFGLPGMLPQFAGSSAAIAPIVSSALFVVWGGANDFLSPSPLDSTPFAVADRAVDNLVFIASQLRASGAQNVLVPGLPDLGLTPFGLAGGPASSQQLTFLSDYFNARLTAALPSGVAYFDTAGFLRTVVANPGAYGFTNVTDACFDAAAASLCATPDQYLFWDDLHPTTRGHALLAAEFAEAVPEPATLGLSACVLLVFVARRRRKGVSNTFSA